MHAFSVRFSVHIGLYFDVINTVTSSTTSGWSAARTDAAATFVNLTALNQL